MLLKVYIFKIKYFYRVVFENKRSLVNSWQFLSTVHLFGINIVVYCEGLKLTNRFISSNSVVGD